MKALLTAVIASSIVLAGIGTGLAKKRSAAERRVTLIMQVDGVRVRVLPTFPRKLRIDAHGTVNTGGWSRGELRLIGRNAVDGLLEFAFVAQAPTGYVTQALEPISAATIARHPRDYRGVRVISQTNAIEVR